MSRMHTIPQNLPGDWLMAARLPQEAGLYTSYIILQEWGEVWAIQTAYWKDDERTKKDGWQIAQGKYCKTLKGAIKVWKQTVNARLKV